MMEPRDNTILLEIRNDSSSHEEAVELDGVDDDHSHPETCVDVSTLDLNGWEILIRRCRELPSLHLRINRDILQQKSTYFRSLIGGNFRESSQHSVKIVWDIATCCCLLQCMCLGSMHISSSNFEQLLEGAAFFGIEEVMFALVLQLTEAVSSIGFLKCIPKFWSLANGMGLSSVSYACVEALAINFEVLIKEIEPRDLPSSLLAACLDHDELTIRSEKALCQALLSWISFHTNECTVEGLASSGHASWLHNEGLESECEGPCKRLPINLGLAIPMLLLKVRSLLLPIDFILEHFPLDFRVNIPLGKKKGVDVLLSLVEETGRKKPMDFLRDESDKLTLRITRHLERLDLSGCQQVTCAALFRAVLDYLRTTNSMDSQHYTALISTVEGLLCDEYLDLYKLGESSKNIIWFSLFKLSNVNLAKCWRLDQEKLVAWLWLVCPNLKALNLSHCPQLHLNILPQIAHACKDLETIDMSLNVRSCPVQQYKLHEVESIIDHRVYKFQERTWSLGKLLTRLRSIFLQGRTSLTDGHLRALANCCPNLSVVDLRGCSELTDIGISKFLANLDSIEALGVAFTHFGPSSIGTLLQKCTGSPLPSDSNTHSLNSSTQECSLSTLDLEGCQCMDIILLAKLLSISPSLMTLNLANTEVGDHAMLMFEGTSLQTLDVRETQVSLAGLGHIIERNASLKVLNIMGCKRLILPSRDSDTQNSKGSNANLYLTFPKDFRLQNFAIGWGLSDCALMSWRSSLQYLVCLSVGLGGRLSETALPILSNICPFLAHLSLCSQVVSGDSLMMLLNNLQHMRALELNHCLGEISQSLVKVVTTNLTSLRLERGVTWMRDEDLHVLGTRCKSLRKLTLIGCNLLTSSSLDIIACLWRGMAILQLEECGNVTLRGGSSLFVCKSLQRLVLRHTGCGLKRDFALEAISKLPLLQGLSLDLCDSIDEGFDTPPSEGRKLLSYIDISRCMKLQNSINTLSRRAHRDTMLVEWDDLRQRTMFIKERL